ncbi:MAG: DNA primase [Actinomycetota bacterium]
MAGRILDEDVEEVRNRASIGDIAAEYMQVRKAGSGRLKALCPFHPEKTPSFTLDSTKNLFHCFGCGKGGNVYTLVMELENLSFVEAVEKLAQKTGITLRYENLSPAEKAATGKRQRMVAAHREALAFYHEMLLTKEGQSARDYLKSRGFNKQTAVGFAIGFSPKGRDALVSHLKEKGFALPLLIEAGLARKTSEGVADAFRGRVMFPIHDVAGDPVAFGARLLDGTGPKYLNTAETPIWHKGRALYALNSAKASIVKDGRAVVVEGYTDVIALHQAGVKTAVASCGTALGLEHFKLLRRFTDRAILAYDADQAGQAAAARAFEEAFSYSQEAGIDSCVIELPAGADPADFVTTDGGEAFTKLIDSAVPVIEYRLRRELKSFDVTEPEGRARALRAALPLLRQVNDEVLRREYSRRLANWVQVDEDVVFLEMQKDARPGEKSAAASVKRTSAQLRLEREALQVALQYPDLVVPYLDRVGEEDFSMRAHQSIWQALRKGGEAGGLASSLEDANARRMVSALAIEEIPGEVSDRLVDEIFSRLKEFTLTRQIDQMKSRLQALNPIRHPTDYEALFEELMALEGRRREMSEDR